MDDIRLHEFVFNGDVQAVREILMTDNVDLGKKDTHGTFWICNIILRMVSLKRFSVDNSTVWLCYDILP